LTLYQVLTASRERLVAAGISPREAAVDVDVFARTILGWDQVQLITERSSPVPGGLEPRLSEWIMRRVNREPSAYIVNVREFWGLDFHVSPAVLIPRPETELIVGEALRSIAEASKDAGSRGLRIADIGTGSGCIAVSLAHEATNCHIVATDVSPDALTIALENASRHGVASRIQFVVTSYLDAIDGNFDIIVANPPYVRDGDKTALAADVRHEPDVALFGGANGLRDIEGVLDAAIAKLRRRGRLVMEFGFGQEADVRSLVARRPALRVARICEDLQGIPRTAVVLREH
jgi:release factor glutamine methyltransferase